MPGPDRQIFETCADRPPASARLILGLAAGAAGGLVGAGVKLLGELVFPPRMPGEPIPPAVAVSKVLTYLSGSPLLDNKVTLAVQGFHWTFSIGAGAIYGVIAEFIPIARVGYGAGFGIVLLLLTHETTLPLLGLSLPWSQIPAAEHASELFTHILFGLSTEGVRRLVSRRLTGYRPGVLFPDRAMQSY